MKSIKDIHSECTMAKEKAQGEPLICSSDGSPCAYQFYCPQIGGYKHSDGFINCTSRQLLKKGDGKYV